MHVQFSLCLRIYTKKLNLFSNFTVFYTAHICTRLSTCTKQINLVWGFSTFNRTLYNKNWINMKEPIKSAITLVSKIMYLKLFL